MGEVGKTYALLVTNEGETYTSKTSILAPTPPVTSYWLTEPGMPNQFDGYFWEADIIGYGNGNTNWADTGFEPTFSPAFDDTFFDGLTFNFCYENRFAYGSTPDEFRGFYEMGDNTVGIKLSKIDNTAYEFYKKNTFSFKRLRIFLQRRPTSQTI